MDFELFNIKLGMYESEIVNYKYVYHVISVEETMKDNPNIFVENGGSWVFVPNRI
jgi:hypothetical protein